MSESRTFMLNGTEVQSIAARLESFFRTEKSMEVQSSKTVDGFVMQASQPKDGWKTLAGMRLAVSVQMTEMQGQLTVTVGEGQWNCLWHGPLRSPPEWAPISRRSCRVRCFRL